MEPWLVLTHVKVLPRDVDVSTGYLIVKSPWQHPLSPAGGGVLLRANEALCCKQQDIKAELRRSQPAFSLRATARSPRHSSL
jgi:hypothetical protein